MTKEKHGAPSSYTRYFLTRFFATIAICLAIPVCGLVLCMIVFVVYELYGSVQSVPDRMLVPTAVYLYEHPQPTLDSVKIYKYEATTTCYEIAQSEHYNSFFTDLYLNGVRVPPMPYLIPSGGTLNRESDSSGRHCIRERGLQLEKGFHLLELVLKSTPWTIYSTYQWAINVEE